MPCNPSLYAPRAGLYENNISCLRKLNFSFQMKHLQTQLLIHLKSRDLCFDFSNCEIFSYV